MQSKDIKDNFNNKHASERLNDDYIYNLIKSSKVNDYEVHVMRAKQIRNA